MADIVVGVKLTADGQQYVGTIDQANQKLKALGDSGQFVSARMDEATSMLAKFATVGASIALAHQFVEISDAATTMNARLASAVGAMGDFDGTAAKLLQTANTLQYSFTGLAQGAVPIIDAIRDLGGSSKTATDLVQALAAAAKAGGQSEAEAAQQMQQFANVLTLGVQGGRDLSALLRENDNLARALADGLGVSTDALRKMAEDGTLDAQSLVNGILSQFDKLQDAAAKIPPTIGGSMTRLFNSIGDAIGKAGWGANLAEAMDRDAQVIEGLRDSTASLGDKAKVAWLYFTDGAYAALGALDVLNPALATTRDQVTQLQSAKAAKSSLDSLLGGIPTPEEIGAEYDKRSKALTTAYTAYQALDAQGAAAEKQAYDHAMASLAADRDQKLQDLAKRGAPNFGALFSGIQAAAQQATTSAQLLEQIEQASLGRQGQELDNAHALFLVSDEDYYRERGTLQQQAAETEAQQAQTQYQALLEAYRQAEQAPAIGADQVAAKKKALVDIETQMTAAVVKWSLAEDKAGDAGVQANQAIAVAQQKVLTQILAIERSAEDYARGLQDTVDDQRLQLSLIGQTATVQAQLTAQAQLERQEQAQLVDVLRQINDEIAKGPAANQAVLDALTAKYAAIVKSTSDAASATNNLVSATQDAADRTSALQDAWHAVDGMASQFVQDLQGGWSKAMSNMAATLKNTILKLLYEMTIQKWVVSIFANVSGAGAGTFAGSSGTTAALSAALGGGGGSNPLSGISSLTSLLGGGGDLGGLLGGSGGLAGLASSFASSGIGASLGLSTAGAGAFAGAEAASGLGAVSAAEAGGLTAAGAGLVGAASMIPVVGTIAALAYLAYTMFSQAKGGPKSGGYASTGNVGALPLDTDNNRYYTPNTNDSDLSTLVSGINSSYTSILSSLGGTGTAGFAAGYDVDPQGTADSRLSIGATDASGNVVYSVRNQDEGKGTDQLQSDLQLDAQRALLAALQASNLPDDIAHILNSVSAATATQDQINKVLAYAQALKTVDDAIASDPAKDAADAIAASNQSVYETFQKQGQALETLASSYDGSVDATNNLATATAQYRQDLVALLVQINQVTAAIHSMFQDTYQSILTSGMTPQQKYEYDQKQAQQLYQQALTSTDPAQVQQFSQQINALINDAFGNLSPEEQNALRNTFLQNINTVDAGLAQHLTDIGGDATASAQQPYADVQTALTGAADKINDAGTTMQDAADTTDKAAQTMSTSADTLASAAKSLSNALANINVNVTLTDSSAAPVGG
jgi:tape measure domain-containing protein